MSSPTISLPANDLSPIIARLKRASGQLQGVLRMLDEHRSCEDVLTQLNAVEKALSAASLTLLSTRLTECLSDPDLSEQERSDLTDRLQKLFLTLA